MAESHPLTATLQNLPIEVGALRRHTVVYSCLDVSEQHLALGSEQGYVWVVDRSSGKLLKEFNVSYEGGNGGEV